MVERTVVEFAFPDPPRILVQQSRRRDRKGFSNTAMADLLGYHAKNPIQNIKEDILQNNGNGGGVPFV